MLSDVSKGQCKVHYTAPLPCLCQHYSPIALQNRRKINRENSDCYRYELQHFRKGSKNLGIFMIPMPVCIENTYYYERIRLEPETFLEHLARMHR